MQLPWLSIVHCCLQGGFDLQQHLCVTCRQPLLHACPAAGSQKCTGNIIGQILKRMNQVRSVNFNGRGITISWHKGTRSPGLPASAVQERQPQLPEMLHAAAPAAPAESGAHAPQLPAACCAAASSHHLSAPKALHMESREMIIRSEQGYESCVYVAASCSSVSLSTTDTRL